VSPFCFSVSKQRPNYGHLLHAPALDVSGLCVYGKRGGPRNDRHRCGHHWGSGRFETSSTSGRGVRGVALASTGTNYGVYRYTASTMSGYAMYAAGNFVASGTKSCVVRTSRGPTLVYCQESPECWFEDFRRGRLKDGHPQIELSGLFLEAVTVDDANPLNVFIQLMDNCNGAFVITCDTRFEVIELRGSGE
jgi:hypothetical protein